MAQDKSIEFQLMKRYLDCNDEKLHLLIKKVGTKYPQVDSSKNLIHMLAKDNNMQFSYRDNNGVKLVELDKDLDPSLDYFLI